jgi:hypothetical protein
MTQKTKDLISRRALLVKLGLATGVAYVAPTFAGMDIAKASTGSASSGPSRPSTPSRPSRPSNPSRPRGTSAAEFQWRWDPVLMQWVRITPAP